MTKNCYVKENEDDLKDYELENLAQIDHIRRTIPNDYSLIDNYLCKVTTKKQVVDGVEKEITDNKPICEPMYINSITYDTYTEIYYVKICILVNGKYIDCQLERSEINTSDILDLGDRTGANITSSNARDVVEFLTKYNQKNAKTIPHMISQSTFGWTDNNEFLPYVNEYKVTTLLSDKLTNDLKNFKPVGTFEEWKTNIWEKYISKTILAKFCFACALYAPLLKPLKERSCTVYLWDESGSGKTALMKCILTVYGDPNYLMTTFNSTQTAILSKIALLNNLPILVDEKQQAKKDFDLKELVYCIGNEKPRERCDIHGTIQKSNNWKTIVFATGEEPLDIKEDGANNRCIELRGKPFDNEETAKSIHQQISCYYGTAGKAYIEEIIKMTEDGSLSTEREDFKQSLTEECNNQNKKALLNVSRFNECASIGYALYIFESKVLRTDKEESKADSLNVALSMLEKIIQTKPEDKNMKAISFLYDYYVSNRESRFYYFYQGLQKKMETHIPQYAIGQETKDLLMFINDPTGKLLSENGYDFGALKNYLKKNQLLELNDKGQNPVKTIGGKKIRPLCIKLNDLQKHLGISQDEKSTPQLE